ncbi:hypothetical protein [Nitrosomonas sp. sh817]|uniref:hypothetical protein n=1 Tax=Nitrosomonas sp. sh817 TaxID=3070658 RepID=UPI0027DBF33D|nr:hypothetical protein [Nitrosomonas sp. sh817]WMJ09647.1 hypothetical protein RBH92_05490 [Nitrosomonas sp. sh817]
MDEKVEVIHTIVLATILVAIAISMVGCAASRSTAQHASADVSTQYMYPMTAEQADKVITEAMNYQFPDAPILRVELPYKGYFVTRRFLLDSQDFTARMILAKGIDQNGKTVSGFYFEVLDAGTMPISGSIRASSLFDKIIEIANNISKPILIAR